MKLFELFDGPCLEDRGAMADGDEFVTLFGCEETVDLGCRGKEGEERMVLLHPGTQGAKPFEHAGEGVDERLLGSDHFIEGQLES
jgi:hypothetical protein